MTDIAINMSSSSSSTNRQRVDDNGGNLVPPPGWAWPVEPLDDPDMTSSQVVGWPLCNGSQMPGHNDCVQPLLVPLGAAWLDIPVYGFISPAIITFTAVTNSLVCVVLLRPNMRTATNVLLVAMALSDMLTGLWPMPFYVYLYTFGHAADFIPYTLCFVYRCLTEYLPIVCHTASIWLTVALAVHRYLIPSASAIHLTPELR